MKQIEKTYPKVSSPCNCMNIRRAAKAVTQFYDDTLKESGLTITQLGILSHIENAEMISIGELAQRMRSDRTTLNRNIKPLVAAGFIDVVQGKDLRVKQLSLTTLGQEKVNKAFQLWGEAQTLLTEYLGNDELERFTKLLSKIEALIP